MGYKRYRKRIRKGARRYNKFQRKAYKRKAKAYRNRQQKVSVKTIKSIAKAIVKRSFEKKFVLNSPLNNYIPLTDITNEAFVGSVVLVEKLLDNDTITIGTDNGQRIGKKIFLKSISLKMEVASPINCNVNITNSQIPVVIGQSWCNVHWMIVRNRNAPSPERFCKASFYDEPAHIRDSRTQKMSAIIKKGTVRFRDLLEIEKGPNAGQIRIKSHPQIKKVSKYVKINKKITFSDQLVGHLGQPYWLVVFCTAQHQGVGADEFYNGLDVDGLQTNIEGPYNPSVRYQTCLYYTDA